MKNPVVTAATWAGNGTPNISALARALDVTRQAVQKYHRRKKLPEHHAKALEELSGGELLASELMGAGNE